MKLNTRAILAASAAVIAPAAGAGITVYRLATQNRVDALREEMNVVLKQAETVAERMDHMHRSRAFDLVGLLAATERTAGGRPMKKTSASTDAQAVAMQEAVQDLETLIPASGRIIETDSARQPISRGQS